MTTPNPFAPPEPGEGERPPAPAYGTPPQYGQPPYVPPPGYVAKSRIRQRGEQGAGLATAGIVLGWVGIGFLTLFVVLGVAGALGPGHEAY